MKHGANVNIQGKDGDSPLILLTKIRESLERIQFLVEHGADLNLQDKNGATPLIYACYKGEEPIIRFLIGHGADMTIKDKSGNTPMDLLKKYHPHIQLD